MHYSSRRQLILLAAAGAVSGWAQQHKADHMQRRFDPKSSAGFDSPEREAWQKPAEVIAALGLADGQTVADIGAGTGYFTVRLARHNAKVKVIASDIEASMVEHIRERAGKEGLSNVTAVQASESSANLTGKVDRVLLVNTYHHIPGRVEYFKKLRESLQTGGRVAIVEWKKNAQGGGPPREHRKSVEEITSEMKQSGYRLAAQHQFLERQEFLIFE
ncbi:MAG: class I SAM-dependent methyltransferase [Bryobacterales bacterium]|nr:class I SAM-dependent methyltransferase [Bryobacterales bacterium]